jgi:hypothetical protein
MDNTPHTSQNTLIAWWKPANWLKLAHSVWIDQAWYREHVRPKLDDAQQRLRFNIQAILGNTLIVVVLLGLLWGIANFSGLTVNWARLATFLVGSTILVPVLITFFSEFQTPTESVADNIIFGLIFNLIAIASALGLGSEDGIPLSPIADALLRMIVGLIIGASYGLHQGVARGMRWNLETRRWETVFVACFFGLVSGYLLDNLLSGILAIVPALIGVHYSNEWATRDLSA